jgi:hypothetical protein
MKKVKTDGKFSCRAIKSKVTGQYVLEDDNPEAEVRNDVGSCQQLLVPKRGRKQTMRQVNAKSSLYSN